MAQSWLESRWLEHILPPNVSVLARSESSGGEVIHGFALMSTANTVRF